MLSDAARLQLAFFAPPEPWSVPAGAAPPDVLSLSATHRFWASFTSDGGQLALLLHPGSGGSDAAFPTWVDAVSAFVQQQPDERWTRRRPASGWPALPRCADCGRCADEAAAEVVAGVAELLA